MTNSKGGASCGRKPIGRTAAVGKGPGEPGAAAGVDERDGESPCSLVGPASRVADAELERVADELLGPELDSHVPRAYGLKPRGRRSVPTPMQSTAKARKDRADSKAIAERARAREKAETDAALAVADAMMRANREAAQR
jgi:hypothetical protein